MDTLPEELLLQTVSYLDAADLVPLLMVSRTWNRLCKADGLWRQLYRDAHFASTQCAKVEPYTTPGEDWYGRYQASARLERNWSSGASRQFQLPQPAYAAEGHTDAVYALQLCGEYLVTGSLDRSIRVWNLQTERLVGAPWYGHLGGIVCLHVDPDQDVVASGGTCGDLVTWKFSSQKMIRRIDCSGGGSLLSVKLNARYVVTSSADRLLRVWEISTLCNSDEDAAAAFAQPFKILSGHAGRVNAIELSGDRLISVSGDNTVKLWDISSGACLKTIQEPRSLACVSVNRGIIVCGGVHQSLSLYDTRLDSLQARLSGHTGVVRAVRSRIDGASPARIVSGSYDGTVRLWNQSGDGAWASHLLGRDNGNHVLARSSDRGTCCASHEGCLPTMQRGHEGDSVGRREGDSSDRAHSSAATMASDSWIFGIDMDECRVACCGQLPVINCWDFTSRDLSQRATTRILPQSAIDNEAAVEGPRSAERSERWSSTAREAGVRTRSGRLSRRPPWLSMARAD